jgi:predicted nucleic acid-binding protein
MNAIDTNVWIYCHDTRDQEKQQVALQLIETVEPIVLLWQVGCEFIAASRKLERFGFTQEQAWQALADM